jgi:hypothetical protein
MAKLKLTPDPTFTAKVDVPVPGKGDAPVAFTFIYRDTDAFKAWQESLPDNLTDAETLLTLASGWDLDDPWTPENVERFVKAYPGGVPRVVERYLRELKGVRAKN